MVVCSGMVDDIVLFVVDCFSLREWMENIRDGALRRLNGWKLVWLGTDVESQTTGPVD